MLCLQIMALLIFQTHLYYRPQVVKILFLIRITGLMLEVRQVHLELTWVMLVEVYNLPIQVLHLFKTDFRHPELT